MSRYFPASRARRAAWSLARAVACVRQSGAAETADARVERILSREETLRLFRPEPASPAPLKTSVTTLARQRKVLSDADSEETVDDKRRTEEAVRTFRLDSVPSRPAFLEEEESADAAAAAGVGTATHRFIRLLRLEELRREGADVGRVVRAELARMKAEGILTEEEAGRIRVGSVISFFAGPLGARVLRSPDVRREAAFTMRLDPHGPTMVQGVIDCAFTENGDWILIDYKTDRDTAPETFVPRHEAQMNWYREALERLTGKRVREMWLVALRAGRAYPVERREIV